MRWVPASLPLVTVALLAGCGGAPAAAPRSTQTLSPSPTWSPSPTPSYTGTLSSPPPVPTPPSPTPSPSPTTKKCGEIPTPDPKWYWREEAVPPATCAQARSILPRAAKSEYSGWKDFTVSGWRCNWEKVPPYNQVTGNVFCHKGSRTAKAVYLKRK